MGYSYRELCQRTPDQLYELETALWIRDSWAAAKFINRFRTFNHKIVRVVKGRKVPIGTTGRVTWMGIWRYSKGPDTWGLSTVVRVRITTEDGEKYFTDVKNVELVKEDREEG